MSVSGGGGFWTLPAWGFAPERYYQSEEVMGEASAARVGNYLPISQGHLNLLASLSAHHPQHSSANRQDDQ